MVVWSEVMSLIQTAIQSRTISCISWSTASLRPRLSDELSNSSCSDTDNYRHNVSKYWAAIRECYIDAPVHILHPLYCITKKHWTNFRRLLKPESIYGTSFPDYCQIPWLFQVFRPWIMCLWFTCDIWQNTVVVLRIDYFIFYTVYNMLLLTYFMARY